jgi:hypothetical protein
VNIKKLDCFHDIEYLLDNHISSPGGIQLKNYFLKLVNISGLLSRRHYEVVWAEIIKMSLGVVTSHTCHGSIGVRVVKVVDYCSEA